MVTPPPGAVEDGDVDEVVGIELEMGVLDEKCAAGRHLCQNLRKCQTIFKGLLQSKQIAKNKFPHKNKTHLTFAKN